MLFLLCTLALAHTDYGERNFEAFMTKFEKVYDLEEKAYRLSVFNQNLKTLDVHNAGYEAGNHTWFMKVTQFADMTPYEFSAYVKRGSGGGYLRDPARIPNIKHHEKVEGCGSVDWVAQGKVTPVKNQGNCGSCWSFSTTGAIEGRYSIRTGGSPTPLSEQELVDCDHRDSGCNGGLMDYGFYWVETNGGLCSESAYPYTSGNTGRSGSCQKYYCSNVAGATVSSYTDVTPNSESQLENAVCAGPVSVAIEADQYSFQMYGGGVLTGRCGANLDHGVLAVGFGTDGADQYWKVKNSWGTSWGEAGYIRMCKNCGANNGAGECGIAAQPSFPNP